MFRKSFLGLAAALAVAGTSVLAQAMIKIGAIAPKTGPLAGGAVVTQWPNVQLWVEQVNGRRSSTFVSPVKVVIGVPGAKQTTCEKETKGRLE